MTPHDILEIVALILGPILAVQISEFLSRRRAEKDQKLKVFKILMTTRASTLSPQHIEALNTIDIEFFNNIEVVNAWKEYLDHLNTKFQDADAWQHKRQDLFINMLYEMSKILGYVFDKTYIKNTAYIPQASVDIENEQTLIRKGFARVFEKGGHFPVKFLEKDEKSK